MQKQTELKKILYVITKGNFGGAQRYVYDLATNLPKNIFEVVVASGPNPNGKTGLKEKLEEKEIRVIELKESQRDINIFKDIKTFFEIRRIIKKENPEILHLNSSKIGALGALAGRLCNTKKIIFTGHAWAFNENRNIFAKTLILLLHWFTIVLTHKTILVSHKVKKDIEWLPFIKNKITVIHNGIEDFKFLEKSAAKEKLGITNIKKNIIISLAELNKNKGIDIALKGISLLQKEQREQIMYLVAGDGEEKENLETQIKELHLESSVKLLGFFENAKTILSGADILLLPSRTEAFPYVILEAGLVGLPIISTSVGGIPEVINDMQNGILIHSQKPKEIAEAISYLLDHPEQKKEFGMEIKETISTFFLLNKMLRETSDLY